MAKMTEELRGNGVSEDRVSFFLRQTNLLYYVLFLNSGRGRTGQRGRGRAWRVGGGGGRGKEMGTNANGCGECEELG